ncbi:hypothetical protein [Pseudobacteriovorax antillogorgiicola]|uniref:Lipoprotein n=1 Tax=Pseudobacteriovorax antillogorgiicola TaxID=1513793 RepID=A0A1Y6BJD7_9BACT|nr:hypothetical protein [Pseudobacteriovorax antillogorgiicola]TCS55333.1 hypothetical protein EDD56_10554 [Pseudobacteriovorax antillogorgiicola]SMF14046.1 hypothetical protein SAMN06296036_105270 [Pseudobacteriovorax antillogorgiicola]
MNLLHLKSFCILSVTLISCNGGNFNGQQGNEELGAAATSDQVEQRLEDIGVSDATSLADACEKVDELNIQESKTSISYAERRNCNWNQGPNLEPRDRFVQAFETSKASIQVPAGSVLCSIDLASQDNARMHYDDFLFLTLEDKVIFGSNQGVTSRLDRSDDIFSWDFSKIAGLQIGNFESPYYCIGGLQSCSLPPHDQEGPIALALETKAIAPIALEVAGQTQLALDLIATGDNDDEDCMHTQLDLDVTVKFIKL